MIEKGYQGLTVLKAQPQGYMKGWREGGVGENSPMVDQETTTRADGRGPDPPSVVCQGQHQLWLTIPRHLPYARRDRARRPHPC